jgi:hypothetical protein
VAIANVGDGGYNSAAASGGTASVTLAFPAGIATGNAVVAVVCAQFGGTTILTPTVTTPTGWTKLGSIVGAATTNTQTQLYLFGAIWSSGLTGVFAGASLGIGGMDGEIRGLSGTGSTVGTAFGNFTSISVNSLAAVAIPGPSGFTSGQWNLWASINYSNNAQPTSSPAVSNIYYNAGAFEAFMIGTTAPGSAPGTETYTWASAGNWDGVGVTILPAAPVTFAQVGWWPNDGRPRRLPVDTRYVRDSEPPLRNRGILVPTIILPPPWFDPPKRWVAPPGFEPTWTRNYGILVPTNLPPQPWFDPPKRWVAPPGFDTGEIPQAFGILVKPSEPWFDPPKRWKAPPPFETQAIQYLGIRVPASMPSEPFWEPARNRWLTYKVQAQIWATDVFAPTTPAAIVTTDYAGTLRPQGPAYDIGAFERAPFLLPDSWWQSSRPVARQAVWNTDVLQPFAAAVVQPTFVPTDWWSQARRSYSTLSWDGNFVTLGVIVPTIPQEWWTTSRAPYRELVWDSQTPQFFGVSVPSSKPSEPWFDPPKRWIAPPGFEPPPWRNLGTAVPTAAPSDPWFDPPKRWKASPGFEHPAIPPFGTTVPTAKPSEPWFDPPKRWVAPPGFAEPPWRNLGTTVPTTKPSEPWFDPPQRWSPRPWFEVTWFQNYGIPVPTTKPSEPWFDPPKRWQAGPGFEPQPLKAIISYTATPSAALPQPWFDPPQRWTPRQWFEVTWFRNLGTTVPTAKPSEPWFDPPKRWNAPPGFEPTWVRPFGTQVPTSALPPEWWSALRRWPSVSTWTPDVFRPLVAAVVTPSFVSAEFWVQARRQVAALSWDGVSPLSPLVQPPLIGAEWWTAASGRRPQTSWDGIAPSPPSRPVLIGSEWWTGAPNVRRRAEWWDFLPPGSRLVPYMDQAWWGLTARAAGRADDWRLYPSITPSVGVLEGWQAGFFDTRLPGRRSAQEWVLGPFFAFLGTPTFVPPLQIVNAPTQTFVAKGEPVISTVYDIDIINIVNGKPISSVVYATDIVTIVKKV